MGTGSLDSDIQVQCLTFRIRSFSLHLDLGWRQALPQNGPAFWNFFICSLIPALTRQQHPQCPTLSYRLDTLQSNHPDQLPHSSLNKMKLTPSTQREAGQGEGEERERASPHTFKGTSDLIETELFLEVIIKAQYSNDIKSPL